MSVGSTGFLSKNKNLEMIQLSQSIENKVLYPISQTLWTMMAKSPEEIPNDRHSWVGPGDYRQKKENQDGRVMHHDQVGSVPVCEGNKVQK